jgi:transcriptional regulator with XRE-family HTH domain
MGKILLASAAAATATVPLRDRRILLRAFRKQFGIGLVELGKLADISQPMLSQFERGDRDLSSEAWARVLAAIQKLLADDDARHEQEQKKAMQTAEKLGARIKGLENLAAIARLSGLGWTPSEEPGEPQDPFAGLNWGDGSLARLKAIQLVLSDDRAERERQLAALDDPIISELIDSFRNEITKLEARTKELQAALAARKSGQGRRISSRRRHSDHQR